MDLKIEGNVVCGFPSPGEECKEEPLDFNTLLVKHKVSTFCLRAYGNSMSPIIEPNDILVVDRSLGANDGDIVVAESNGDFTVKYLKKKEKSYVLVPENKDFENINVDENTRLFGVVTGIVRRFK